MAGDRRLLAHKLAPGPSYRWLIFLVLVAGYIAVFFQRMAPAIVATDVMRDLAMKEGMMGILTAAFFYPHAFMNMPAGLLADKWGASRTIGLFFVIACVGSIAFALAESVVLASIGRFLVGIGTAMLFVPAIKIFSNWFQGKEFAWVTGMFVSAGGIGSLLSATPLATATTILGWRASFVYAGLVSLIIGLLTTALVLDKPPRKGMSTGPMQRAGDAKVLEIISFVTRQYSFWPLAVWFFFCNGLFFAFAGLWAGPYLEQIYHLDKDSTGNVLAMIAIGIAVGGALLSGASNYLFRHRKPVMILSTSVVLSLFAVLTLFSAHIPIPGLYVLYLLLGIFGNGVVAVGFTVTKETFPPRVVGTALGLVNVFGFLGAAVLQSGIGFLLEAYNILPGGEGVAPAYQRLFLLLLIGSGLCLIASLLVRESPVADPVHGQVAPEQLTPRLGRTGGP